MIFLYKWDFKDVENITKYKVGFRHIITFLPHLFNKGQNMEDVWKSEDLCTHVVLTLETNTKAQKAEDEVDHRSKDACILKQ